MRAIAQIFALLVPKYLSDLAARGVQPLPRPCQVCCLVCDENTFRSQGHINEEYAMKPRYGEHRLLTDTAAEQRY